jgi:Lon protease-like protein
MVDNNDDDDHDGCCALDDEHAALLATALPALPIFPLSGTVFFPHTLLPLHIFEPRYRQMTEQVIATHQNMAIVCVDANQQLPPRNCARVAGLGRLVHHERLPDGRFHILLQGMGRVALDDELPMDGLLYRRARARLLHDHVDDSTRGAIAEQLATLRGCYARLSDSNPECKDTLGDLPLRLAEPDVLADLIAAALIEDVPSRQRALEETSLLKRMHLANGALADLLLRTLPGEAGVMH